MPENGVILIIDSDPDLLSELSTVLEGQGYAVLLAADGLSGLRQLYAHRPDLVLLEAILPRMDGWEVCERIRQVCDIPVIMLSSLDGEDAIVRGLSLGADDYMVKPIGINELLARIEAIRRRAGYAERSEDASLYVDDNLLIDIDHWQVERNGAMVDLTATEMRVLFYLLTNAGRILTHEQILEHVWAGDAATQIQYVKVYIWKLRKKLEPDPRHPRYILTERGLGYRFTPTARGTD
ncbi:MAG: response regulator transcription factor [Anaerolineae bacterium]|nr:response regulator transcription factor [Anaerolineae bacterium]